MNLPIGINTAGIVALILLITSMIFLIKSLNKYKGRAVIISILIGLFIPPFLADSYQKYLATGIYAIKYDYNSSNCNFEKINDTTIHLQCALTFENFSSNAVHFTVEFYDPFMMEDDDPILELLNENGPLQVTVTANTQETIQIDTKFKTTTKIDGGGSTGTPIIIKSEGKVRKL